MNCVLILSDSFSFFFFGFDHMKFKYQFFALESPKSDMTCF